MQQGSTQNEFLTEIFFMKTFFLLTLAFLAGCASCERDEKDFTPIPGGKCCDKQERVDK